MLSGTQSIICTYFSAPIVGQIEHNGARPCVAKQIYLCAEIGENRRLLLFFLFFFDIRQSFELDDYEFKMHLYGVPRCVSFPARIYFLFSHTGIGTLSFDDFCTLASRFMTEEEEDSEAIKTELREAFRLYDKEGEYIDEKNLQ